MNPQIVLENESITVWYHPDVNVIHHKIHKMVFGAPFREALSAGTAAMRMYRATKWLSDDRNNTVVNKEDEEWGRTVWFADTLKAGWKCWAIVQPAKVLGQMNIKRISQTFAGAGITAQFFAEPDEALTWLGSV